MHVRVRTISYLLVLLFVLSNGITWGQAVGRASDESGTLVMVGRTADAVIVGVDSTVHPTNPLAPRPAFPVTPLDRDRKLVEVGEHSACAISGYLGWNEAGLEVSASMRGWIADHPKIEAIDAIDDLLDAAVAAWDRRHYSVAAMPNRQIGSPITDLVCGDFANGHPVIVRGQTYVIADGRGGQVAAKTLLRPMGEDTLYVDGVIPDRYYLVRIALYPQLIDPIFNQVSNSIRADESTMTAFSDLLNADKESATQRPAADVAKPLQYLPSSWQQQSIKDMFTGVFAAVEDDTVFSKDVGTPNNVRIMTRCGRFTTTVEGQWPTCPPPPRSQPNPKPVKRHWWSRELPTPEHTPQLSPST
jgi:hypothetical protein